MTDRNRWVALYVLCVGMLMIVLDATVVNVALPAIQSDLGFSQSGLAWVVACFPSHTSLSGRGGSMGTGRCRRRGVGDDRVAGLPACGGGASPVVWGGPAPGSSLRLVSPRLDTSVG